MSNGTFTTTDGARVIRALVLYSLAEYQAGHATTIRVNASSSGFTVEDDGRGHAIGRTVADQPYLKFIYTHLSYPFTPPQAAPIQLQGIGMSLINALCGELTVKVRRPDATLQLTFKDGVLQSQELLKPDEVQPTSNTISGIMGRQLAGAIDSEELRGWLGAVRASAPSLRLYFNGEEVNVPPDADA
jgi:DNA gyrase/topoisomerase IV subunit B